jgi:hypothetical protein
MFRKTSILRQFNPRLKPKLGLIFFANDMDVHPFLLIRENLECITAFPAKNRTHDHYFDAKIDIIHKTSIINDSFY